jgi:RNA polymerase subunit RPABC4/transcription elongation factor Spt4
MVTKIDWSRLNDVKYLRRVLKIDTHPCPQCGKETEDVNRFGQEKKYHNRQCKQNAHVLRAYHTKSARKESIYKSNTKRKKRLLEENRCPQCGMPKNERGYFCADCQEAANFSHRSRYGNL